jgi:penicillin amidase
MGRIPIRPAGNNGGMPVPGVDASTEWLGFIDQMENPQLFNPEAGYIVSSNNPFLRPDDFSTPTYSAVYDFGYRAERIENLILATPSHSMDSMTVIQTDTYNVAAEILIPVLQEMTFEEAALSEYVAWLADWDYIETVDSPQAAFFNAVWKYLNLHGLDELIPTGELNGDALEGYLLSQMLTGAHPLWANGELGTGAGDRDVVVAAALSDAIAWMTTTYGEDREAWAWGEMHQAKFQHIPLGRLPAGQNIGLDIMLQDIYRTFNRSVAFAGNNLMVNRGNWSPLNDDFTLTGGISSMRMVVDFSNLDNSRFIIPMGQSGDPFSPHYDDLLEAWATGGYVIPGFSTEAVQTNSNRTWVLTPG